MRNSICKAGADPWRAQEGDPITGLGPAGWRSSSSGSADSRAALTGGEGLPVLTPSALCRETSRTDFNTSLVLLRALCLGSAGFWGMRGWRQRRCSGSWQYVEFYKRVKCNDRKEIKQQSALHGEQVKPSFHSFIHSFMLHFSWFNIWQSVNIYLYVHFSVYNLACWAICVRPLTWFRDF